MESQIEIVDLENCDTPTDEGERVLCEPTKHYTIWLHLVSMIYMALYILPRATEELVLTKIAVHR